MNILHTIRLALEIADEESVWIIECNCALAELAENDDSGNWLRCGESSDEGDFETELSVAMLDRAIEYLDLRGRLERHPEHQDWFRARERA